MLMLLSVDVTSVLFSVLAGNFVLTMGFYWSYTLLLQSPVLSALEFSTLTQFLHMHITFDILIWANVHYLPGDGGSGCVGGVRDGG